MKQVLFIDTFKYYRMFFVRDNHTKRNILVMGENWYSQKVGYFHGEVKSS